MTALLTDLREEILALKKEKDATILAHYYQEGEIQELADYVGDSLNLSRAATKVTTSTIVFCGVHFMAETAKILNPAKRVLLPDLEAGCSLAASQTISPKLLNTFVRSKAPHLKRVQKGVSHRRSRTEISRRQQTLLEAPSKVRRHAREVEAARLRFRIVFDG